MSEISLRQFIKQQVKQRSLAVRVAKVHVIEKQKSGQDASALQSRLYHQRRDVRHLHLLYGFLRGKTLKQMESSHAPGNAPSINLVAQQWQKIAEDYLAATGNPAELPEHFAQIEWMELVR